MKPIKRPALTQAVQAYIKEYIISNELKPGDRLPPETQFADELGISRGSVREAVKSLESLGILEVRHGNGLWVREPGFEAMRDILAYGVQFDFRTLAELVQLRKWLEEAAIGDVVRQADEEHISHLEAILDNWMACIAAGKPTSDWDREFHRVLYEPLNNRILTHLIDIFWLVFQNSDTPQIIKDEGPASTHQQHLDIIDAIRRRDPAEAEMRIRRHFAGIEERLQNVQFSSH